MQMSYNVTTIHYMARVAKGGVLNMQFKHTGSIKEWAAKVLAEKHAKRRGLKFIDLTAVFVNTKTKEL